ncbi:hypothetical protein [Pseudogemmobacter faecipullorum]|uniref:Lipoprotein n=1 Tax=Pseudogemmobacter faecipullorum TaxID=2755041 RepID=A0ABS8CSE9_9RHOB|nr:hypothetical protein [Pseudogemmobacter faecipullorum]MCB5412329.1 hypothetical protein [Pseudogemmobacter faecipullorum]
MTYKVLLLLSALGVAGCVAAAPTTPDTRLVRVMVETSGKHKFERLVSAAQPMADRACASEGKQAKWAVATSISDTKTRLSFTCH